MCWRKLLRVTWTARRLTQSILKEINPEYSLERLMLKLKLQYFGHLMQRAYSLKKIQILGKLEVRKRRGWQRMRRLDGIIETMDMSLSKFRDIVKNQEACVLWSMSSQRVGHDLATEQQQFLRLMSGRVIPTILGKGWGIPGIRPPPTFWPLCLALEVSWCWWACH